MVYLEDVVFNEYEECLRITSKEKLPDNLIEFIREDERCTELEVVLDKNIRIPDVLNNMDSLSWMSRIGISAFHKQRPEILKLITGKTISDFSKENIGTLYYDDVHNVLSSVVGQVKFPIRYNGKKFDLKKSRFRPGQYMLLYWQHESGVPKLDYYQNLSGVVDYLIEELGDIAEPAIKLENLIGFQDAA